MKDFEKSVSFGLSFISTLFFSGLSGYGVGKYYFEAPEIKVKLSIFYYYKVFNYCSNFFNRNTNYGNIAFHY